jgi:hypothetical protein
MCLQERAIVGSLMLTASTSAATLSTMVKSASEFLPSI